MKLPFAPLPRRGLFALAAIFGAVLTGCSDMRVSPQSSSRETASLGAMRPAPAALGTAWGEHRDSRVTDVAFERAHSKPDFIGELRYQNAELTYGRTFRGAREIGPGLVAVGLKGETGRWLEGTERDGRVYISGRQGERYEIVIRNLAYSPIEVVVSVDGLDVLDGRSANFSKRGYIIEGRGTARIPGWRTSSDSVAAFRFAAVGDSYVARKHEDTRNAGVIGVAVFKSKTPPTRVFAEPPPQERHPNPFPGER